MFTRHSLTASAKIILNLHIGAVVKGEESYAALARHLRSFHASFMVDEN